MKLKFIPVILTSTTLITATLTNDTMPFQYRYEIRADSFHPIEELNLYYYKEELIETYEKLCLNLDAIYKEKAIRANLHLFEFNSRIKAAYQEGIIHLTVGSGRGFMISGELRKDQCDSETIREKYYFLDLFK